MPPCVPTSYAYVAAAAHRIPWTMPVKSTIAMLSPACIVAKQYRHASIIPRIPLTKGMTSSGVLLLLMPTPTR